MAKTPRNSKVEQVVERGDVRLRACKECAGPTCLPRRVLKLKLPEGAWGMVIIEGELCLGCSLVLLGRAQGELKRRLDDTDARLCELLGG